MSLCSSGRCIAAIAKKVPNYDGEEIGRYVDSSPNDNASLVHSRQPFMGFTEKVAYELARSLETCLHDCSIYKDVRGIRH